MATIIQPLLGTWLVTGFRGTIILVTPLGCVCPSPMGTGTGPVHTGKWSETPAGGCDGTRNGPLAEELGPHGTPGPQGVSCQGKIQIYSPLRRVGWVKQFRSHD